MTSSGEYAFDVMDRARSGLGGASGHALGVSGLTTKSTLVQPDPGVFDEVNRNLNFYEVGAAWRLFQHEDDSADPITGRCRSAARWSCWDAKLRYRHYTFDLNPVTWGPAAGTMHVATRDQVQLTVTKAVTFTGRAWPIEDLRFTSSWTLGTGGLDTDSFEVSIAATLKIGSKWRIPLFLECHFGPMENLSDYTAPRNVCGGGLRFF